MPQTAAPATAYMRTTVRPSEPPPNMVEKTPGSSSSVASRVQIRSRWRGFQSLARCAQTA